MNYFEHPYVLTSASASTTTGASHVQPQAHPLMEPQMHFLFIFVHPLVHRQMYPQVHLLIELSSGSSTQHKMDLFLHIFVHFLVPPKVKS